MKKSNPLPRISVLTTSIALAGAMLTKLAVPSARAVTYYWDNNGTTAGFGTAAGMWAAPTTGDATQGWSTSTTGVTLPGSITTATTASSISVMARPASPRAPSRSAARWVPVI